MRNFALAAGVLLCTAGIRAQVGPGWFKDYGNGTGFINDQGIPEYRPKNPPPKKRPAPKPVTRIPLGPNVVLYGHTIGYINSSGTAVLEDAPPGLFDAILFAMNPFAGSVPLEDTAPAMAAAPLPPPVSIPPDGVNCPDTWFFVMVFKVNKDPGNSAGPLGGLNSLGVSVAVDPASGSIVLHSPDSRFDGMTGTGVPVPGGTQYSFSDTRTVNGNGGTRINLSFTVPNGAPGQPQPPPTDMNVSMLAPADASVGATSWTGTSSTLFSNNVAACNSPGIAGEPVAIETGEYLSDPAPDLVLGGPLSLEFKRHYGSLLKTNLITGAMGDNWMNNFEVKLGVSGGNATLALFGGATMRFTRSGSGWALADKQPYGYQLIQSGSNYQFLNAQTNLIYTFNSAGALTGIQDRNGNALTVTPSGPGPAQVSDGFGRTLTFSYSPSGNLTSIKDQTGRTVTFGYAGGALTSVTDAAGKATSYSYVSANLRTGLMATVKRPAGNTTVTQTWDSQGRVLRQSDGLNNAATFSYDSPAAGSGTITDPLQDKTQYDHPDTRNNTAITDANGKVTTIVYDAANHPLQITDPLGNKTVMTYDASSGLPLSVTDASGATTSAAYTAQPQGGFTFYVLSKLTYEDGAAAAFAYDGNGNLLAFTDPAGKVTQFTYNKQGQVLTIRNALGGITTYTYNSDGTMASVQSPAGDATQFSYDALKRPVKVTHPDGSADSFAQDARGRLVQHTPAAGAPETYTYDDNGNLVGYTGLSGGNSSGSFDANDQPVAVKDATGAVSSVAYDAAGRPSAIVNGAGEKTTLSSDAVGRPLTLLDAAGNGPRLAWNAGGYLQSITDGLGKTTSLATDPLGRMVTVTSPLNEKTSYAYDKAGRPVTATTPLAHSIRFSYDALGNLSRLDLPAAISASFVRNELGEVSGITDPNGSTWKRTYDSMGRLSGATDPLGQATTIQYNSRNRPIAASNPAGNVTLTRDALGDLTQAQFSDGTVLHYQWAPGGLLAAADNLALGYDANGEVVSSNGIAVTRDGARRVASVTYGPGMTLTYRYNAVGDLAEIDDWANEATTFQYDAAHRLIGIQRPNGANTQYSRDADGRITGTTETTPGGNYSIGLTRDAEGKVLSSNRNVPQLPVAAAGFNGYAYDAASQIAGATYDALGRLTADGFRTYTWDGASRLTSYSGVDGAAQFTYDGLGMRVSRTTAAGEQDYVWNYAFAPPVPAIVRADGADLRYYVYLPDGTPLYSIEAADNSRHFYHYDETGSTLFLTDDSGAVSDAYGVTPYGEDVTQSGPTDNPFTFHGAFGVMQEAGTSLFYMRARYYDSSAARFLSRDLVASLQPRRIAPYQFALDNPIGYADATGWSAEPTAATALVQYYDNAFQQGVLPSGYSAQVYAAAYRDGMQRMALGLALANVYPRRGASSLNLGAAILQNPDAYLNYLADSMMGMIPEDVSFVEYLGGPSAELPPLF